MLKNVILTGATGMIGSLILQNCLSSKQVNRITCISRKSSGVEHPKLLEILHHDFENFSAVSDHFINQQICFFCLGVYTGKVSKDVFRRITVDYTLAFAKILKTASSASTFCLLSGQGADRLEKSKFMFARDKGAAENGLVDLHFNKFYIFRPGYIYPDKRRKEPNFSYRVMRALYKPVFSKLYPNIGITSTRLANVMTDVGLNDHEQKIFENDDIRKYPLLSQN